MKIRYPGYYGKFRCLAGSCPDTCCVDWEIRLDRETEKRYKREALKNNRMGKKFRRYIKHGTLVPVNGICPFLDGNRLCEICTAMGEGAMCRTCRQYPRHTEDYGCLQERILLLSCPEAARLVLTEDPGKFFVRETENMTENMEGIDRRLLKILLRTRKTLWKISRDRTLSVDQRCLMMLSLGHDMQRRLDQKDGKGIQKVLKRYEKDGAGERFRSRLDVYKAEKRKQAEQAPDCRFSFMADFMECLAELDPVGNGWEDLLEQCRKALYHSEGSRHRYEAARAGFMEQAPELACSLERLLGYFIYSFFLAALYDRDAYGKVKLAVYCCLALEELFFCASAQGEEEKTDAARSAGLSLGTQTELCHLFARQVENSDQNRERLLERLEDGEYGIFHAAEILG